MSLLRIIMSAGQATRNWILNSLVKAPSPVDSNWYGESVAISRDGSTMAIGAGSGLDASNNTAEAVYVFKRVGSVWTEQAKLTSGVTTSERFGVSVSLSDDGNTLIVGARQGGAGAVYVFLRSGATWTKDIRITPSDGVNGDRFGSSVSVSSDGLTFATGSYNATVAGRAAGAVYVYVKSSSWTLQQKLQASDSASTAGGFGFSLSISGDGNTLVIGAPSTVQATQLNVGSVYAFSRSGSTWTELQKIAFDTPSLFGNSVATSIDCKTILIGAPTLTSPGGSGGGAFFLYQKSGSTWVQQVLNISYPTYQVYQPVGDAAGNNFGRKVSMSSDGSTFVVGAPYEAIGGFARVGAAYVYSKDGAEWKYNSRIPNPKQETDCFFGYANALSGDGGKMAVGAYQASSGSTGIAGGEAYTYDR